MFTMLALYCHIVADWDADTDLAVQTEIHYSADANTLTMEENNATFRPAKVDHDVFNQVSFKTSAFPIGHYEGKLSTSRFAKAGKSLAIDVLKACEESNPYHPCWIAYTSGSAVWTAARSKWKTLCFDHFE